MRASDYDPIISGWFRGNLEKYKTGLTFRGIVLIYGRFQEERVLGF